MFSHTTLPGITVHEVAPGHFSHGRALRRVTSEVRRTLHSSAFIEGWAHYGEELCVEEGFGAQDPRIPVGVWLEALVRVTRLACAIGVHTAGMTIRDAARRFEADTHLSGPAALSEALGRSASTRPTAGTPGKLEILKLRERARKDWGAGVTCSASTRRCSTSAPRRSASSPPPSTPGLEARYLGTLRVPPGGVWGMGIPPGSGVWGSSPRTNTSPPRLR